MSLTIQTNEDPKKKPDWKHRQDQRGASIAGYQAQYCLLVAMDAKYAILDRNIVHGILRQASKTDDMRKFIDYYLHIYGQNEVSIQVKAQARSADNNLWIELHGKAEDHIGWLNAPELDYVAFERVNPFEGELPEHSKDQLKKAKGKGGFYFVKRERLKKYCDLHVDMDTDIIYDNELAYHRRYRRVEEGREETYEELTIIHLDELIAWDDEVEFVPYAKVHIKFENLIIAGKKPALTTSA